MHNIMSYEGLMSLCTLQALDDVSRLAGYGPWANKAEKVKYSCKQHMVPVRPAGVFITRHIVGVF